MIYIHAVSAFNAMGCTLEGIRANLLAGESPGMQASDTILHDGREVMVGRVEREFDPLPADLARFDSRNNRMLLAALEEIRPALDEALTRYGKGRVAIILGTGTSGIAESEIALSVRKETGAFPDSFNYLQQEFASPSEFVATLLGSTGPALTISTSCSSSARVFLSAARMMDAGLCDAALVGGADTLCRFTVNGFYSLEAIARGRSNPFSVHRDGINIGEGCSLMVVSREPSGVALLGAGESSDAHHISSPDPEGGGAERAMRMALENAGLQPRDIGYVNLHGTGTPLNDHMESHAVARVFGLDTPCSTTKPLTGHTLGSAGITEAAICWLLLTQPGACTLPPQLWDGEADPELPAISLLREPTITGRMAFLSNSFAFGGNNTSLILGTPDALG